MAKRSSQAVLDSYEERPELNTCPRESQYRLSMVLLRPSHRCIKGEIDTQQSRSINAVSEGGVCQ